MSRPQKLSDQSDDFIINSLYEGKPRKVLAGELGVTPATLSHRISDIQQKQGLLLQYRSIQTLQLTELQARILEAITPEKIDEAPLKDLVLCYKVLKEKELVGDGKPSEIKGLVSYLIQIEKEQAACEEAVVIREEEFNDVNLGEKLPCL